MPPAEDEITARAIWAQDLKFGPLLEQFPAAKHRRALESFKAANPERWQDVLRGTLNSVSAKLCREFASLLIQEGKMDRLKETLARLISQHTASSELLLWLAKERSDAFADILGPEVFRAMLTAMERDQFNEKRSNRLRDFILDDQELLVELIGSADIEVIKDLTRALQLSPVFDDMDKRSLLARIVKSHPAVQSLISGEQTKQEAVAARFLGKPGTAQDRIPGTGAEEDSGQLQGNRHRPQLRRLARKPRIQGRQGNAENAHAPQRGTGSPARPRARHGFLQRHAPTSSASAPIVQATDLQTNQPETFTILGAWDSDPDKGIISYLSPVAQSLLNHKVGDEVEFEIHGARHRHRIENIAASEGPPPHVPVPVREAPAANDKARAQAN